MYDDIENNMHPDEDTRYTWPIGGEDVVVQWQLMANDGIITQEMADQNFAEDAAFAKAALARRRPSRMSPANRLRFLRTLSLHGLTHADLEAGRRTNPGFAQQMINYAQRADG